METAHPVLEAHYPISTSKPLDASFARGLTRKASNQNVKSGEVGEVEVDLAYPPEKS
jgi:hypothetical protein